MDCFRIRALIGCIPVAHDKSLKIPFIPQYVGQEFFCVADILSVDAIVGGHNRPRLAFLNRDFETAQIDFSQSPFGDVCRDTHPVVFLIVAAEVLDADADAAHGLNTAGDGGSHLSGNDRVFGIILKVAPAKRIPMNVQPRCKPHRNADFFHFAPD